MPKKKTVDAWGIPCAGYECDPDGNVTLLWCKICREFNELESVKKTPGLHGIGGINVETYIRGTSTVKKNNFSDHITKSNTHEKAVRRLGEIRKSASGEILPSTSSLVGVPRQATLLTHLQKLTTRHRVQLTKKFQLAHFLSAKGKSFKLYAEIAKFENEIHKVDLGNSYTTDTAGAEIIKYLSKSNLIKNITEPINSNSVKYYSIMNDGSSSAKTMDEKELFVIKTASQGTPKFTVMSLEEPEDTNAEGLKKAMEASVTKLNLTCRRSDKEIGMCTDGASVNVKMHRLVKADIGEHYLLVLCPCHKIELAMNDAFKNSTLNSRCEEDSKNIYYLFKKANLRWRLFKRQSRYLQYKYIKYRRPAGTRWVEHQVDALTAINHNLPVFISFSNQQIVEPYNRTMKMLKPKLEGMLKNATKTNRIIFNCIKQDVLTAIRPISKILQKCELILPELITVCSSTIKTVKKLSKLVREEKGEAFKRKEIFPTCASILEEIKFEREQIIPQRTTRADNTPAAASREEYLYHDYLLKGSPECALEECSREFVVILTDLETSLTTRLGSITEEPIFKAMAEFLDTKCYSFKTANEIYKHVWEVKEHFETLLVANGCDISKLEGEMEIVYQHVIHFMAQRGADKCWPALFQIKEELSISNILHIAEICIALPISNAESERVFSFLWRVFSKERQSLDNNTLEDILRLRCDSDHSEERYGHAIELFLSEYPNGEVRKRRRRLDGHEYPSKRSTPQNKQRRIEPQVNILNDLVPDSSDDEETETVNDIDINEISDDEWSSDSESDA